MTKLFSFPKRPDWS